MDSNARQANPSRQFTALLPLTSLRFAAALYILLAHTYRLLPQWGPGGPPQLLIRFFSLGFSLVGLFFVLSGFALGFVYLRNGKPIPKQRFFVARFARLYPLYIACMLLDTPRVIHVLTKPGHEALHTPLGWMLAGNLLLLQSWAPAHLALINASAWSLSDELLFYILFVFAGYAVWRLQIRWAVAFAIVLFCAGCVPALLQIPRGYQVALYFHPLAHVQEFLLGLLLARFYVWILDEQHRKQRLANSAGWLALATAATAAAFAAGALGLPIDRYRALLQHGALFPLYALLILLLVSDNRQVLRWLGARWLVVLGEASYGLYLVHEPVLAYTHRAISRYGWPAYLGNVALCIGLSLLSVRYFEAPLRKKILAWQGRRAARKAARAQETMAVASIA